MLYEHLRPARFHTSIHFPPLEEPINIANVQLKMLRFISFKMVVICRDSLIKFHGCFFFIFLPGSKTGSAWMSLTAITRSVTTLTARSPPRPWSLRDQRSRTAACTCVWLRTPPAQRPARPRFECKVSELRSALITNRVQSG